MDTIPTIETSRTTMTVLSPHYSSLMRRYYLDNREHLARWEPEKNQEFYTVENWNERLENRIKLFNDESAVFFSALNKKKTHVLGVCNFSNIARGVFQGCHLGFSISEKYQGQGLMHEILDAGMAYIFSGLKLHRIMANYIPDNHRSATLLQRLGFEREGLAKAYLKISGEWQDHILTSKINPHII